MFLKFPLATLQIGKEKLVTCIILSTTSLSLSIIVCYLIENFFWQKPTMMSIYRYYKKARLCDSHSQPHIRLYDHFCTASSRTCGLGRTNRWAYPTRWPSWHAPCATSWSSCALWSSSLKCPSATLSTSGFSCPRLIYSPQGLFRIYIQRGGKNGW